MPRAYNEMMRKKGVVQLIGVGQVPAKPAGELKVGDTVYWNYYYKSTVFQIEDVTEKTIRVTFRNEKAELSERTFRKTRLVACKM